jgi:NitT/TauT family transport system substrate-binding protein
MQRPAVWFAAAFLSLLAPSAEAADAVVRIGVLKFGTVDWELAVIADHGLDQAAGIRLESVQLAGTPATQIALQSGEVDVIVADLPWVARQRAAGADLTFAPFSSAVGALMVPAQSPIHTLADLDGKRLGVAGSPIDKSWLILRLVAAKRLGVDIRRATTQSFGAPPLLDEELKAGRLDAVLTYWPFAARLEADGMRRVISVNQALEELGLSADLPLAGFVLSERWAKANPATVQGLLTADRQAKDILASSDDEWRKIAPLTGARSDAELVRLRESFRAGIPRHWGDHERLDAERLYGLLAGIDGAAGQDVALAPGTFFDDDRF